MQLHSYYLPCLPTLRGGCQSHEMQENAKKALLEIHHRDVDCINVSELISSPRHENSGKKTWAASHFPTYFVAWVSHHPNHLDHHIPFKNDTESK